MAKPEKQYSFVDVDKTILEPSPQRVRNILTLEERVRAIQAYDFRPMYTKVAKMFNCSWEQIKNIIANRDAILEFYAATKTAERQANLDEIRQRKIRFLGECMYEYIQRAQFYTKADITEELLRMKAFEFRDVIQIENFMPNKVWINHFKATYNFSLSNRQITLTRTPPASLDLKDIMTYCSKNKQKTDLFQEETEPQQQPPPVSKNLYRTTTRIAVNSANDAALQELKQRWRRKINFLEKALFEYWNRSKYHHKKRLNENSLRKVAFELKEMLKIDNFYPDNKWLNNYVTVTYPTLQKQLPNNSRPPPLSLDLKDILSYCSRLENKKQTPSTITLAPKEPPQKLWNVAPASQPTPTPIVQIHTLNLRRDDNAATQQQHQHQHQQQQPQQQLQQQQTKSTAQPETKIKEEIIDLGDDELLDIKPNLTELAAAAAMAPQARTTTERPQIQAQRRKREREEGQENTNGKGNVEANGKEAVAKVQPQSQPQPLKIRKIETINKDAIAATTAAATTATVALKPAISVAATASKVKEINEMPVHSPGHWSEHSDREEEELPKHVRSYSDALKLLRPLEEFAMLEENYRVIGLIGQLEDIFKNPPKKHDEN